ncbi:unnamed protein product [Prunus armeniaca]|uniref:Uncharacterized protein n=1 Tax=Prunus armeniaca TaxID=36596 RepID=A0A6J5XRE2_PRUAR|nr:unnamed protein product [Prunus armeniaca]
MEKLVSTREFVDFINFYSNPLRLVPFYSNFIREVEEQMDLRCKKQSTTIKGINSVLISDFLYRKYMPMIASKGSKN